ncbi:3-oxoacyl-[acyl-carrier protein] reductase [Lipingzhangella halophila]|uniref:3-oxoacyl-[acyl-carrier protein] reductase n=1 Tax=Lipingzhangella halophila TaxID=1783352 RepID=A0A7W7W0Y9_9ACTN|nr:SDR family oxidoreductase [Lipingzhangella halophila]MBB4930417.1 3-oxoacyl-[acyl-carrier protein] reductase [Lipingzhangella halophila]
MDTGLKGKTALIPGSTSGIGLAIARALDAEGANVVLSGRRGDRARAEADALTSAAGVEIDLAEAGAAERLVDQATAEFGDIDILVLNSGGPPPGNATEFDDEKLRAALEQLLIQQRRMVDLVLPRMRERNWGRIVGVGSSGVQQPIPGLALSNIARAGIAAYLKSLTSVVAADGVTVNMVLPGRIDTERVAQLDSAAAQRQGIEAAEARARSEATIPAGRYGRPDEFAALVTFLCGNGASYVNGEQIRCDGGLVGSY